MEEDLEEFGRQQFDAQTFEPPYEDDPYAGQPNGELQAIVNYLESAHDDQSYYAYADQGDYAGDDEDFDDDDYDE